MPKKPPIKRYGEPAAQGAWASAFRAVDNTLNFSPGGTLTRYWANGWRNLGSEMADARANQVTMSPAELKAAQAEVYENFKNITFIYAFHGSEQDLLNHTAKFKLGEAERQYLGVKQDAHGQVTDYLDGARAIGFLNDKTGARAAALLRPDGRITITIAGGDLTTGTKAI